MNASPELLLRSRFVALPEAPIAEWCARWGVNKLRLAGSAVHGPFRSDSDIDFVFYASYRAPIYAPDARPKHDAAQELRAVVGRDIDLVCPRMVAASGNPYAIYNLLVEPRFERWVGLLWYLRAAARTLRAAAFPEPEHALAAPLRRQAVLSALLRFARAAHGDERVAEWKMRGLGELPWADVRAVLDPVLAKSNALGRVRWPQDETIAALVRRLDPYLVRVELVANGLLPAIEPVTPQVRLDEAMGDAPVPRRGDRMPSADMPTLHVASPYLSLSEEALTAFCRKWRIYKLVLYGSALTPRFKPTSDVDFLFYASAFAPIYVAGGRTHADALAEIRSIVRRDVDLVCARRLVTMGNPFAMYNILVRETFSREDNWMWFVRRAARSLSRFVGGASAADPATLRRAARSLFDLMRSSDRPERVAFWERIGLGDVPWAALHEVFAPVLESVRAGAPVWPDAERIGPLVAAFAPHLARIIAVCEEQIGGREPTVPIGLVIEALGDLPPRKPGARHEEEDEG